MGQATALYRIESSNKSTEDDKVIWPLSLFVKTFDVRVMEETTKAQWLIYFRFLFFFSRGGRHRRGRSNIDTVSWNMWHFVLLACWFVHMWSVEEWDRGWWRRWWRQTVVKCRRIITWWELNWNLETFYIFEKLNILGPDINEPKIELLKRWYTLVHRKGRTSSTPRAIKGFI